MNYKAIFNRRNIGKIVIFAAVFIITVAFMLPIIWQYISAFKPPQAVMAYPPTLKFKPTLTNYYDLQETRQVLRHLKNSILIVGGATAISVFMSILAGYSLARFQFKGGKNIAFILLILTMIPTITLIIPIYDIMRKIQLLGSPFAIILVYIAIILPFNIWLMRGFFTGVPKDIEEAALIDGCSRIRVLFNIVIPISKPGIFATTIFSLMFAWGDFVFAGVLGNKSSFTLPVIGAQIEGKYGSTWGQLAALVLVISLPMILFSIFAQKYLVEGLTHGAVKG